MYIFTNVKVNSPQELKGQKMGSFYTELMQELGCTPIRLSITDKYTAMERGLVDGYTDTTDPIVSLGLTDVTKYMIKPGFYGPTGVCIMNLDKFNSLPPHLQKVMLDAQVETEDWLYENWLGKEEIAIQEQEALGVETIQFTGEDAKWLHDLAYKTAWDKLLAKDADMVSLVRPMIEKR
jgi:TRAP-type C4-dicarboxylate transport system substrate-binding protein